VGFPLRWALLSACWQIKERAPSAKFLTFSRTCIITSINKGPKGMCVGNNTLIVCMGCSFEESPLTNI
jgi:hypothetical protein